jgi:hypothetical protein
MSLDKVALMAKFSWSDKDFESAINLEDPKFPTASKRTRPGTFGFDLVWQDTLVEQWFDKVRERAALRQLLIDEK